MCGIAGYYSIAPFSDDVLLNMTRSLKHRGPDAEGYYRAGALHFGHRRLSVIDVAGSQQPLFNEDGTVALVFNGEIYNYAGLRQGLIDQGHRFRTTGDSEVLVHAYEQYGERMVEKLSGMFAFAIWDSRKQRLFLARDHLGVKPLYYFWDGRLFAFASELKAMLEHPAIPRDVDLDAVALYLEAQFIPAPRSIFRGIKKLLPAHTAVLSDAMLTIQPYWQPDYSTKFSAGESEIVEVVDQNLRRSVQSMLVADVPLGAFVSGGVDSSLIAALMTDVAHRPIDVFTLGFRGDDAHSEHAHAERVARHLGCRHHILMVEPASVLEAFDDWTDVFDEPFGDQASLPTLMLAGFARQKVTVALTGEGADEVFAGYDNYYKRTREERLVELLTWRGSPIPWLVKQLPAVLRKDRILKAVSKPIAERYGTIPNVFDEALHANLLSEAFQAKISATVSHEAAQFFDACNSSYYMDKIMYVDMRMWLPDDLLTKVDRATMAHSLEARVPYLDHRLVEVAAQIRPETKHSGVTSKYILKKVAEKYLPKDTVYRRKQGFHMPLRDWLANELRPDLERHLSAEGLLQRNLFNVNSVTRLLAEHQSGKKDHAIKLWNLLVLERWFQAYAPDFAL